MSSQSSVASVGTSVANSLADTEFARALMLDRILAATYQRAGRRRLLPAAELRLLIALLVVAEVKWEERCQRAQARGETEESFDPEEPFVSTYLDLQAVLSPRHRCNKGEDVRRTTLSDEMLARQAENLKNWGHLMRTRPHRKAAWTWTLCPPETDHEPAWPLARKLAVATVADHRLGPSEVAALSRSGYAANADGVCDDLSRPELGEALGMDPKTAVTHLGGGRLQEQHGLRRYQGGPGAQTRHTIELCEPWGDVPRPARPASPNLNAAFVTDALAAPAASAEEALSPKAMDDLAGAAANGEPTEQTASVNVPAREDAGPVASAGSEPRAEEPDDAADGTEPAATRETKPKASQKELRAEAVRLYRLMWHKDLVEEAVKLAEGQLQEGHKVTLSRRITNFYRPVWELLSTITRIPQLRSWEFPTPG